ncbi:hypothetical protein PYCCODRAFT_1371746 [Trametes coccinea BRFM310]|uniref:Uncharacterized protein n=1 Tax=Trametes coccinea (strain BRFM310) TaxID=1353009 RepID=A0A1Y2IHP9_TRAC3|nr:hypothetical protein PYCCODRAFT_1371746 [Trametes coccinea BRFM310]
MSSMFHIPEASVATTFGLSAVNELSGVVVSLSESLDKDIEKLQEVLNLPRDPARWTIVLAARLSCNEHVFQERIKAEMVLHHDALVQIHPSEEHGGDLLGALHAAVQNAEESFKKVEDTYHLLNFLCDGYLLHLDSADREALQEAYPVFAQTYDQLHEDVSSLSKDMVQWTDCFSATIKNSDRDACETMLQQRRFHDPSIFARELGPLFQLLQGYLQARQEIRDKCVKLRDDAILDLLSRTGDRVPTSDLLTLLGQYEQLSMTLFHESTRQSEAIRTINLLVRHADLHASAIFTPNHIMLPLAEVHEAFHRYDAMRILCAEVVHRSVDVQKTMAKHVAVLEKARDAV